VKAQLRVAVEGDRVVDLAVDPPLGAKIVDTEGGPVLYLVSTAASLLEDDDLFVDLRVGAGGRLRVRSVAAQVAHPCLSGGSTSLTVRADVGNAAMLWWSPEPLILCAQSNHRSLVQIELSEGAGLEWADEVVLGRAGEDPGAVGFMSELHVSREGVGVLEDGLELTPASADAWRGPAVLGANRFIGSRVSIRRTPDARDRRPGWTDLASGGRLGRVTAVDPLSGRRQLANLG
jgi:urease accessory protein